MIYRDRIILKQTGHADRELWAVATYLDTADVLSQSGGTLKQSLIRFVISPLGPPLPVLGSDLTFLWPTYNTHRGTTETLGLESNIEPHYLHGKLHHYEVLVRDL